MIILWEWIPEKGTQNKECKGKKESKLWRIKMLRIQKEYHIETEKRIIKKDYNIYKEIIRYILNREICFLKSKQVILRISKWQGFKSNGNKKDTLLDIRKRQLNFLWQRQMAFRIWVSQAILKTKRLEGMYLMGSCKSMAEQESGRDSKWTRIL